MLRQIWHVLVISLLWSFLVSIRSESTTISSSILAQETTEKSNTLISANSTITVTSTVITSSLETTRSSDKSTDTPIITTTTNVLDIEPTTAIPSSDITTSLFEFTTTNVSETEPTTTVSETTTTDISETEVPTTVFKTTTTTAYETTTTDTVETEPTTTVLRSTTTDYETTTTTTAYETTTSTIAYETTTTDTVETEPTTIDFRTTAKTVYEPTTVDVSKTDQTTTDVSKTESTTATFPETFTAQNFTVEATTNHAHEPLETKSNDIQEHFPHLDKPHSIQSYVLKMKSANLNETSVKEEFLQQIIILLAEYIKNKTNTESSDLIAKQLKDKIDQSQLEVKNDDGEDIRGIVKLLLKNLLVTIQTTVSNIEIVGEERCFVKFTFYNSVYCMNLDLNVEPFPTSLTTSTPLIDTTETSTTTDSSENISIKTFTVFNGGIDRPPTTWQKWLSPPAQQPLRDQSHHDFNEPVVVCYYTNWAQYRNGPGRFYPENIDTNLCTHIVYAFAQLTDGILAAYEWNDESTAWSTGMFARMINLRKANRPKILLAVGGWNHGSGKFSDMARNATARARFVTTTIIFLQKHKFDGLDLDWEYPGTREGSRPTDKDDFTKLIVELKAAFRPHSLLLTAAVGAGKPTIDAGYDIPKVCENLDLVNLMAYDLHGSWETNTGLHTALFAREKDTELNKQLTVDWAVRYWLENGCSPSKLVLGLATYGRTFRLASSVNNKIGAPTVGPGSAGLYTGEGGFLAYYEICTRIKQQNWTKVFDEEQKANYAYKGVEWVGFDDSYSLGFKIQYSKDMGLAGIMFWAPDLDDFTGTLCDEGKYPLMNTAVSLIRGQTEWSTSTKAPATSTRKHPLPASIDRKKRAVCYYTNWAQYRPEGGKFVPENLDPSLCTHIIFAFAVLKDSKLAPFEWNDEDTEWSKGMYSRIMELKKKNTNLKILLAVGGWNFGSGPFSDMVADENLRREFVQHATQFIQDHQFDGLDLDWEYPGSREGSRSQDKQLFTSLAKELKAAFEPYGLLLTAAVGAGATTIEAGYEIDKLALYLDFINLMTYDLHGGGWENVTGIHTALYARPGEDERQMTLNQNWAVNYWIQQGMPKEKIIMGLATYGRTFKLANSFDTGIGAPSVQAGDPGKYTREPGFLSYYEICEKLNSGRWTSKYDDVQKSMYAYGEGNWVGYDNVDTMTIRANYIIGKDLGGVMIWAPDLDDFSGQFCNQGRYPLMKTVVNLVRNGIIVPVVIPTAPIVATETTISITTITTTTTTTTTSTATSSTISSMASSHTPDTPSSVVCMTTVNPFVFETIDVKLCSYLILVQTGVNTDVFQSTLSSDTIEQLKTMKIINKKLKVFYSILGRWKSIHLDLITDDQARQKLNQHIIELLSNNQIDGFDIDWNLPIDQVVDQNLLSKWLIELKQAFAPKGLSLSVGISANKVVLDRSYDFDQISSTVDFIRLMAFDWPSPNITSLINPLFPVNNDPLNNIKWAVDYVIAKGIPREQISLGLPTHGSWFGLADGNQHSIGSPAVGSSMTVAYSDICKLLKNPDYIRVYDQPSRSSYAYNQKRKQWISSDTISDVALKASYAKLEGLAGVTLSAIGMDDVDGECGSEPYPLLHAVANVFNLKKEISSGTRGIHSPRQLKPKNVFCSISSKVADYSDDERFTLDRINPQHCTHLLIDHRSSLLSASISDQLKKTNSDLKILLTFDIDENANIEQWKEKLNEKKGDGINILINTNKSSSKITQFIKTIRSTLSDGHLITMAFQLPADPSQQVSFFYVLELHKFVDYVFVLPFDETTIQNVKELQHWNALATFTPQQPAKNIGDFSMTSILMFILSAGVPKEKLILSIPTYGLSYLLENENKYFIGNRISEQGSPGRITNRTGLLAHEEICEQIELDNYERFLSNESIVVIARRNKDFILFDDTQPLQLNEQTIVNGTVELKATFIKNAQLGGVLIHALDMDDYTGLACHRGPFPITSIVSRVFSLLAAPIIPTSTSTPIPIVKKPNPCQSATQKDLVADENDCHYYFVCMPDHQEPIAHLKCPNNMQFSAKQKACAPAQGPCSSNSATISINRSIPPIEVPSSKAEIEFVCPTANGIFPDPSDCTRFFACSNNLVVSMKCPLKTKFDTQSNRCDWTSASCP